MKNRFYISMFICLMSMWLTGPHVMGQTTYKRFSTANGLTSSLVNFIYEDHYGIIWIATEDGLNKYDGVKITSYKHQNDDNSSLANNYVSTLIEDARGNLLVSTYTGMQIYRYDTDDFSPLATLPDGKVMKANISVLKLEKDGRMYGIGDLACEVITEGNSVIKVKPMKSDYFSALLRPGLPPELNVRTTLRYDDTHLLLGSDGNGIKLYDERQKTYTDYPLDVPSIPQDLQKVHHIVRDRYGNLWVAMYQKGVVMIPQRRSMFEYLGPRTTRHNLVGSHCIQSLCRSMKGGMWVGTDGEGLYYLEGDKSTHITQGVPPIINTVLEDSEGTLWVGSYVYPCVKRKANGSFETIEGLRTKHWVFSIKEDRKRNIWIGTMGHGLYCYSLDTKQMTHIDDNGRNPYINCLYITSRNEVLIGTFNGIYNINTGKHLCDKCIVYSIHEDFHGTIWAGSSEGLFKIDGDKQTTFTTKDGMASNTIFAITDDESGKLWFSSNAGLTSFDEREHIFTNYSVSDGIQGNEFSKGGVLKDHDGTLWFAGHEGITYFSPKQITQHTVNLHPRITALYINNIPVSTKTRTGGEAVMDTAIYNCRNFSIAYENNSFSIELATVETDTPAKCSFQYSLDGAEWIIIPDGGHVVSFTNLSSGTHSFRYAVGYNGQISVEEEITIEIRHPWWSSMWARLILIIVIIAIIAMMYFWVQSHEKVKALALISHKIRTPMSLIISPLIQLMDTDTDEQRQKTYKIMLRNAQRLQRLAAQATAEEPIGPISSNNIEDTDPDDIQQSRTTRNIVIVEDDDDVRKYLCKELSSDYHVREATNGKEALDLIFEKMPDAIISDVTMPQMDGITLCRKIKKNIQLAHIPVMLLTARADEESALQGLGIGADAYITKPFNIKIVKQKISNLILLRQQLRNTYQGQQLQEEKLESIETEDYDELFMERLMTVVNKHLGDSDFSIDMLCNEVGISRAGLHRKLKEKTNQSASIFIRNVRLKQAEKLLLESNLRINEIAQQVGFKQTSYFINSFRDIYGISPNEWREQKMSQS